jgi:methylenetetrahydrofolate reductase (NADPH)
MREIDPSAPIRVIRGQPPFTMGMSLEITTRNEIPPAVAYDEIFVTWLPTEGKESIIAKTAELHAKGLKPVPHLVAFKIRDAAETRTIAAAVAPYTRKVFLIRGGGPQEGAFATVDELVATGAFQGFEIGVGGFPEGNGPVSYEEGIAILRRKAAYAGFVVTQWSLNEPAIARFLDDSPLPVYLGVPNRCSLKQLARFAAICGVENSVKGILSNPRNLARFMLGFDPGYIVKAFQAHPRLAKIHVYAFGNFAPL